jgi:hypothetical protein
MGITPEMQVERQGINTGESQAQARRGEFHAKTQREDAKKQRSKEEEKTLLGCWPRRVKLFDSSHGSRHHFVNQEKRSFSWILRVFASSLCVFA